MDKPKKLRISFDLDPETAEVFEGIVRDITAERGAISNAPIAAGLISWGIASYRRDPGIGKAILNGRIDQMTTRKPSARKRWEQEILTQSVSNKKGT